MENHVGAQTEMQIVPQVGARLVGQLSAMSGIRHHLIHNPPWACHPTVHRCNIKKILCAVMQLVFANPLFLLCYPQSNSMVSFYHQSSSACTGSGSFGGSSSLAALGGYQRHSLTPTLGMASHALPHHQQQQHHQQQAGLMCATGYLPPLQSRAW